MKSHKRRGASDCYQDRCENYPFASVGGRENRHQMKAPKYIPIEGVVDYIDGYSAMAETLYGDDWRTCDFSWKHVLTINEEKNNDK